MKRFNRWARVVVPVLSVALLAAAGWFLYPAMKGHKSGPSEVVHLTASNYLSVMQNSQGTPMVIEICTPDVCTMQQSAFDAASVKYKGKALFIEVNYTADTQVAQQFLAAVDSAVSAQGATSVPLAFPMFVFVTSQGSVGNLYEGMLPTSGVEQFTSESLNPPAAAPTQQGSTSITGSNGTTGSTGSSSSSSPSSSSKGSSSSTSTSSSTKSKSTK